MKKVEPVNILFVRGRRRVRSLRISPVYLWGFFLFIVLFILVSVLVINSYLKIISENKNLREEKVKLTRLVNEYKFKSQLASQYHLLIEELSEVNPGDSGQAMEEKGEGQAAAAKPAMPAAPEVKTAVPAKPAEPAKKPPEPAAEENEPLVDVSRLILEPDDSKRTINFNFTLRKADLTVDRVSGYLIVVLANKKVDPPKLAAYPVSIKLSKGLPSTTSYGHAFSIQRGKTVRGMVQGVSNARDFSSATIYIYDRDGQLLLKKELKADNA